jgi:transposase, IS5 family
VWLFRKKLARTELIENWSIGSNAKGYIARGGQIVDASIVPVPKQRNSPSPEENEAVKRGETPAEWERKPAKNRQKVNESSLYDPRTGLTEVRHQAAAARPDRSVRGW